MHPFRKALMENATSPRTIRNIYENVHRSAQGIWKQVRPSNRESCRDLVEGTYRLTFEREPPTELVQAGKIYVSRGIRALRRATDSN